MYGSLLHRVLHMPLLTEAQKYVRQLAHHFAVKMASNLTGGVILKLSLCRMKLSTLYLSMDNPVMG